MTQGSARLLPVHGFVLAGGKSSRMGRDKALLEFQGRSMVEIAVEKLRSFCADVSISGNRADLDRLAPVVVESRLESGPAAGIEAGVQAARQNWALFLPVDAPLVPADLLRAWAERVLGQQERGLRLSYLRSAGHPQPTFCMLHKRCEGELRRLIDRGVLKLAVLFDEIASALGPESMWVAEAEIFPRESHVASVDVATWFSNVNTPADLSALEGRVRGTGRTR